MVLNIFYNKTKNEKSKNINNKNRDIMDKFDMVLYSLEDFSKIDFEKIDIEILYVDTLSSKVRELQENLFDLRCCIKYSVDNINFKIKIKNFNDIVIEIFNNINNYILSVSKLMRNPNEYMRLNKEYFDNYKIRILENYKEVIDLTTKTN